MPQLRYLSPDADDDWESSPTREPSASPSRSPAPLANQDTDETAVSPSSVADHDVYKSVSTAERPSSKSKESQPSPQTLPSTSLHRERAAHDLRDHVYEPDRSMPSTESVPHPDSSEGRSVSSRTSGSPATKRVKTEVIELESDLEIPAARHQEEPPSPSSTSSSRLLNSFMSGVPRSNVPKVRKDEWSDDSSVEDRRGLEEQEYEESELYHRPAHTDLGGTATPDSMDILQAQDSVPIDGNLDRSGCRAITNINGKHAWNRRSIAKKDGPKKKHPYYSVGWRFPKIAREDLKLYMFLATCFKYAKVPLKPDTEAVAAELGINPKTVTKKLRLLNDRIAQDGADFGGYNLVKDDPLDYKSNKEQLQSNRDQIQARRERLQSSREQLQASQLGMPPGGGPADPA